MLDNGKYQVMENLFSQQGYLASVCIDVETRNNYKEYIFNIYSDTANINAFLPLFHGLTNGVCGDFRRILPGSGCIMAVFDYHKGVPLENYLKSLPEDDYPARAHAVGSLLDAAVVLEALPPIFAVSVFSPPYTVFNLKEKSVRLNYVIKPAPEPTTQEALDSFLPYLESAFPKNRYLPEMATGFLSSVRNGDIAGFVSICSAWRRISADSLEEHERYKEESFFKYLRRKSAKKAKDKAERALRKIK